MAYVPDATNVSEPTGDKFVASAAPEFRTLKTFTLATQVAQDGFQVQLDALQAAIGAGDNSVALAANLGAATGGSLVGFIQPGAGAVQLTTLAKLRQIVHIDDYGGNLITALNNVAPYTTIQLRGNTNYNIVGLFKSVGVDGIWTTNTKAGIRLLGQGMPRLNATGTALVSGTVIQGSFINTANDVECYDLGIDVGADVVDNLYAGVWHEGLVLGVNTNYPTPQTTIKGCKLDRVCSLSKPAVNGNAATYMHAMLLENLEGCIIGSVVAIGGYHTFVSKIIGLQASSITALGGQYGEAVIFKSDPANRCEQNEIANLRIGGFTYNGVPQPAGPLRYEALATGPGANTTDSVKLGNVIIRDTPSDSVVMNSTGIVQNCSISSLDVNTAAVACAVRLGVAAADMRRFTIGVFNIVTAGRAFDLGPTCSDTNIGSGIITVTGDSTQPLITFNDFSHAHGRITIEVLVAQTSTYMLSRVGNSVFNMSMITFSGAAAIPADRFLSSYFGTFVFSGNFADSGNAAFGEVRTKLQQQKVGFNGAAKCTVSAANPNIGTVTPAPPKALRFIVPMENAGAVTAAAIQIAATGVMSFFGTPALNALVHLNAVEYDLIANI